MTHSYIEENNITHRYLIGRLSVDEQTGFEEHLVDCPECLDRVQIANRFRRGLRRAVAEDVEQRRVFTQIGLLAWLTHLSSGQRRTLYLATIALSVGLPLLIYFGEMRRIQRELGQVKTAYADLQRRYAQQQQAAGRLEEELQASEERNRQAELQRQGPGAVASGHSTQSQSNIGLPLFALNTVRDSEAEPSHPANEVSIPRFSRWIILSLEFEPDPAAQFYRATILNQQMQPVWNASNLKLTSKDTIVVSVNTGLLRPGNYMLRLEACTEQGRCHSTARYSFRANITD